MHLGTFRRRKSVHDLEISLQERVQKFKDSPSQGAHDSFNIQAETGFLNDLFSFIPNVLYNFLLKDTLQRNSQFSLVPTIKKYDSVCAVIDLSGFCAASESLCEKGMAGLDDLRKGINSSFSSLLTIIKKFDGDIIDFAGDALIVCWANTNCKEQSFVERTKENQKLMTRAAYCCKALSEKKMFFADHELGIHVGLNFGEMCFLLIGGTNDQWRFMTLGPVYRDLCEAVEIAKHGECVLTGNFIKYSNNNFETEIIEKDLSLQSKYKISGKKTATILSSKSRSSSRRQSSGYSVSLPDQENFYILKRILGGFVEVKRKNRLFSIYEQSRLIKSLIKFVPQAITFGLDSSSDDSLKDLQQFQIDAEIRDATVVFVKLAGKKIEEIHGSRSILSTFQDTFTCIQELLSRYDGLLRQFILDDKGIVLIVAFGIAHFTHVDDPLRALDFATDVCSALGSKEINCFVGIATGRVYAGPVGDQSRQDFALVGDVVNLSARLMGYAYKISMQRNKLKDGNHDRIKVHKFVICDKTTKRRASDGIFKFKSIDNVKLKGKKKLNTIYRVFANSIASSQELSGYMVMFRKELAMTEQAIQRYANLFPVFIEDQGCKQDLDHESSLYFCLGGKGVGKTSFLKVVKHQAVLFGIDPVLLKLTSENQNKNFSGILIVLRAILLQFVKHDTRKLGEIYRACEDILAPSELLTFDFVTTQPHLVLLGTKLLSVLGLNKDPKEEVLIASIFSKLLSVKPLCEILYKKPILLAVDDIHFMDELSWVLFDQLLKTRKITMFCCCTVDKSFIQGTAAKWMINKGNILNAKSAHPLVMCRLNNLRKRLSLRNSYLVQELTIEKPSVDSICNLISEQLLSYDWNKDLLLQIVKTSENNVHVAIEIAKSIIANQKDSKRTTGTVSIMELLEESKDWDQAIITSYQRRIDNLPKPQRSVLKKASTFSTPFTIKLLSFLYSANCSSTSKSLASETNLELALEELLEKGFLKYHSAENLKLSTQECFTFVDERVKDTCYQMLLPEVQKKCHYAISLFYIKTLEHEIYLYYKLITHNFTLAEDFNRATEYYIEYLKFEIGNKNFESCKVILHELERFVKHNLIKSNLLKEYVLSELGKNLKKISSGLRKADNSLSQSLSQEIIVSKLIKELMSQFKEQSLLRTMSEKVIDSEELSSVGATKLNTPENVINAVVEPPLPSPEDQKTEKSRICLIC